MSTNSGLKGRCDVSDHMNNEHSTAAYPARRCKNRWKRCQTTGGCFNRSDNWTYRMCYGCRDHSTLKDDLDFSRKQTDVASRQIEDYLVTATAGGDTFSGETSGSSP